LNGKKAMAPIDRIRKLKKKQHQRQREGEDASLSKACLAAQRNLQRVNKDLNLGLDETRMRNQKGVAQEWWCEVCGARETSLEQPQKRCGTSMCSNRGRGCRPGWYLPKKNNRVKTRRRSLESRPRSSTIIDRLLRETRRAQEA